MTTPSSLAAACRDACACGSRPQEASSPRGSGSRPIFLFAFDPVLDVKEVERAIRAFRKVRETKPIVWLDCSSVAGISAEAIEVLSRFAEDARLRDFTLRLIGMPHELRSRLEATPLERFFWLPPSLESLGAVGSGDGVN